MRPELRFETKKMRVAGLGEESCLPDLLGEKILQNDLVFRLDEEDEIYEGYGRRRNAYPYRQYNCYTRELKEQEVQTAVLENDSLRAVFLPQYGGRLWELWDKEKGRSLLYTNDVLRFSNLAVRNAWFSGGVEWNIGVIGHTPLTTEPLYVARTALESGEPVLRMYEYERIRKVAYQMDFWLGEKDRFLNCRMRIVNESSQVIPMYWWSNMAVPEYEGGRVVVPAGQAFTYADGAVFKVDIPVVQGVDVTDYQKIPRSVDYFFDIPQECGQRRPRASPDVHEKTSQPEALLLGQPGRLGQMAGVPDGQGGQVYRDPGGTWEDSVRLSSHGTPYSLGVAGEVWLCQSGKGKDGHVPRRKERFPDGGHTEGRGAGEDGADLGGDEVHGKRSGQPCLGGKRLRSDEEPGKVDSASGLSGAGGTAPELAAVF